MVLKVPRLNSSPLALCDRPFSLLGFGDILVPGMQSKCFMMTQFTCFENKSKGLSTSTSVTDDRFCQRIKKNTKNGSLLRKLCETLLLVFPFVLNASLVFFS